MNVFAIRTSAWTAAWLLATAALLEGCSTHRTDLIASGRLVAEPQIDRALRTPPEVHDDEGDLVVSGQLERGLPADLRGHIDVTVVAPDGTTVYDAQVDYRADAASSYGTPGPRSGSFQGARTRHGSYAVYSVRFPGLPPDGSVVKVRHEPKPHAPAIPPASQTRQP